MHRFFLLSFFLLFLTHYGVSQESVLDQVGKSTPLRVGTTADYRPFTYFEKDRYQGYDIDLARLIAQELGCEIEFVPTTWAKLTDELTDGKYVLAVGGITRTLKRQRYVGFTKPVFHIGKCPLVRVDDSNRYTSIQAINRQDVRIGVNPGGTNEAYVRKHFPRAKIKVIEDNLAIPEHVALGVVDVMMTDNLEALKAAQRDPRLVAVSSDKPWTKETLAFMTLRDDQAFINWLNLFLYQAEADGRLLKLRQKYGL